MLASGLWFILQEICHAMQKQYSSDISAHSIEQCYEDRAELMLSNTGETCMQTHIFSSFDYIGVARLAVIIYIVIVLQDAQ